MKKSIKTKNVQNLFTTTWDVPLIAHRSGGGGGGGWVKQVP